MKVDFNQLMNTIKSFIAQKKGLGDVKIDANTPLLQGGLLDSFSLVELIVDIEKQLGETLPNGALIPEDFETPQVLFNRLEEVLN